MVCKVYPFRRLSRLWGWFGQSCPPADETGKHPIPQRKVVRTGRGLLLAFDDEANTFALSDGSGANLLKINVNEGQRRVQSTTKVIVEAPQIELVEGAATLWRSAMTCCST